MRRISLAFALAGAVAVTGCGGNVSPNSGNGKGVGDGTFAVTVQNGQGQTRDPVTGILPLELLGGAVVSTPAGINCGEGVATQQCSASFPIGTTVTLAATAAAAPAGNLFLGWAGDCQGEAGCTLDGLADKYIVAMFGVDRTAHPNWAAPAVHAQNYLNFVEGQPAALDCTSCHGAALQGQGLAPSCGSCHAWPMGKHFVAAGHNTGACARCHSGGGFRDFIGADGTPSNVLAVQYASSTAFTDATTFASGMACDMCHNSATVLGGGTLNQHKFPSGNIVTMDAKTAICSQCHDGGRGTYEVAQVKKQLTAVAVTDLDGQLSGAANNKLVRAHYLPAASTLFGEEAGNWYEYSAACSLGNAPQYSTQAACTSATPTAGTWIGVVSAPLAKDRNNYTARNTHGGVSGCTFCHNAHTGELPSDPEIEAKCGGCHQDEITLQPVKTFAELEESRQFGFEGDIDRDGLQKSLNVEINGLRAKLLGAIQNYATNVAGAMICFDGDNRFYADDGTGGGTAGDGVCAPPSCSIAGDFHDSAACVAAGGTWNPGETTAYTKFTARLLPATYNYLIATNDVGAWAHNPRYAIEVMYDAIADLNAGLVAAGKTPSPNGNRQFNGHFGAAEDPSPYAAIIYHGASNGTTGESLPQMGFTSGACYQCHGGKGGLDAYVAAAPVALASTVITDANKVSAFQCDTCHAFDGVDMKDIRSDIGTVYFPPQKGATPAVGQNVVAIASADLPKSFAVCGSCHSGRENAGSIDIKIGAKLETDFSLTATNPHYLGAAGMMLGDDAKVMYQYAGQTYAKRPVFWKAGTAGNAPGPYGSPHAAQCTGCHQPKASKHEFGVDFAYCADCHKATDHGDYSLAPVEEEYAAATAELIAAIKTYAAANAASTTFAGICYNPNVNAYWFVETAGGVCQDGIANAPAAKVDFNKMNSKLLKATYNYQWTQKEPGAWAHNEFYVMQVIYDSIVDLGGTPTFTRP